MSKNYQREVSVNDLTHSELNDIQFQSQSPEVTHILYSIFVSHRNEAHNNCAYSNGLL